MPPARAWSVPWRGVSARAPGLPRRGSAASFDHLVCAGQHYLRHDDSERLRGLEIDDELVGVQALDRQVAGLGALKDAAGVAADDAVHVGPARAVAGEAAPRYELARREDGRQLAR